MQKQVSKHRLSILALSILLVLSLALTATFAAFQTSGTTTGTVTFNDTIEITGTTSKTIDLSIAVGTGAVTYATGGNQLGTVNIASGGATFYWQVALTISDGTEFFEFGNNQPALNTINADLGSTTLTWTSSAVTTQQSLNIGALLAALDFDLDTEEIGGAANPAGQLTLTIYAQYHSFSA